MRKIGRTILRFYKQLSEDRIIDIAHGATATDIFAAVTSSGRKIILTRTRSS
jgi:hypothetical protein